MSGNSSSGSTDSEWVHHAWRTRHEDLKHLPFPMLADIKHDLCEQLDIIDPAGGAVDFELWCTAVSAIHGCGACVDSHEETLREKGVREESILAAVRIASVIHGLASVMEAEKASMPAAILV